MLTDTHAHLGGEDVPEREALDMLAAGMPDIIIAASYDEVSSRRSARIARENRNVFAMAGVHPCDSQKLTVSPAAWISELASDKQNKVVAIGEIGLDYHYDDTDKEKQHDALIRQLKLAAECDLPISIHMRDATADCLDLLKTYAKTPFVMHCFSGSVETAMEVVRMGGYISFAGPLTFKNARALPEVAKIVPAERILCETDCPYLTPVPHRGKENEPMYVRFTFDKICELRNADPQRMSKQILQNYHRFLGK